MTYTLKDLVNKTKVDFIEYRKGNLWYSIVEFPDFTFPVPIEDTGDGVFKQTDSSLYFMRYIRRHLQYLKEASAV